MNDHPFPYDLTHTTMPDPMPPTQLTDAMLKKPGFSPSEWIESHRSLEIVAQGLRDGVLAMLKFVDEMNKELEGIRNVDFPAARKALARFDALKEGK